MRERELTYTQAARCETAKDPVCHCRCKGQFHGRGVNAGDGKPIELNRAYFEALPDGDPHKLPTDEEQRARKQASRERSRVKAGQKKAAKWAEQYGESAIWFIRRGEDFYAGIKARSAASFAFRAMGEEVWPDRKR